MAQNITPYMLQRQQQILAGRPLVKKTAAPIAKKSAKRIAKEKEFASENSIAGWFEERRTEMTGTCLHCGGQTCKGDDKLYINSIAHILPKKLFPSVADHPLNWIELCFWKNSCHTNMDTGMLDLMELNCFDLVIERFQEIYPAIDKSERKHIPEVLRQYVNVDL